MTVKAIITLKEMRIIPTTPERDHSTKISNLKITIITAVAVTVM
jgi:hypothetical protein